MDITIRLYRTHDFDLLTLYKNTDFPVRDAMKRALLGYVRGESVCIEIPKELYDFNMIPTSMQFHLKLKEGEDDDAIMLIMGIKNGFRCSFLKNLLRYSLATPVAHPYIESEDLEQQEKESVYEENKVSVQHLAPVKKRRKKAK